MIVGIVEGQSLKLDTPVLVSDSVNFLTAVFHFSPDWESLPEKWVHFASGEQGCSLQLQEGRITAEMGLNLPAGEWEVYLHGMEEDDEGNVLRRATTETARLYVQDFAGFAGEGFPDAPPGIVGRLETQLAELQTLAEGHASRHAVGGADALKPEDIGAVASAAPDISGKDLTDYASLGKSGFYRGQNVSNAPSAEWFYFTVLAGSPTYSTVRAQALFAPDVFEARYGPGTSAFDWKRLVTADDVGRLANPNLLDNWYFLRPVNQRGQTSYGGTANQYTIDRWRVTNANTTLFVHSDYIEIQAAEGATPYLQQILEHPQRLAGKKVTLSVLDGNNGLFTATSTIPLTAPSAIAIYCNVSNVCDVLLTPAGVLSVRLKGAAGDGRAFVAAKLELGTQQTLAHQETDGSWALNEIPDYGEQLLRCQRYYQLFSSADKRPSDKRDFRPELRTDAISSNTGTITIDGVTYYYASADL